MAGEITPTQKTNDLTGVEIVERTYKDKALMDQICSRSRKNSGGKEQSLLCNDRPLFDILLSISSRYHVPVWMMVGIMYKESNLWLSYHAGNRADCRENTNNRWWMKMNHTSAGAKKQNTIGKGCRLQKYDTIEEWFTSLARTIWIWYKGCFDKADPVTCIAFKYVGNPKVAEKWWVDVVKSFR